MTNELLYWMFGVAIGFFIQYTASRIKFNGDWKNLAAGRIVAMSSTGGICAALMGLWFLSNLDGGVFSDARSLYGMWFYQGLAAWGGAELLDLLQFYWRDILEFLKGRREK